MPKYTTGKWKNRMTLNHEEIMDVEWDEIKRKAANDQMGIQKVILTLLQMYRRGEVKIDKEG